MNTNDSPGFASLTSPSTIALDDDDDFLPDPDEALVLFPEDDQQDEQIQFHAGISKKGLASVPEEEEEYMLGTVIVRVVAARGLINPNYRGGVFRNSSPVVNPYASVKFGKTTQRTSDLYSTVNPVWPRDEVFFMDVSVPVSQLTHGASSSSTEDTASSSVPMNENFNNSTALLEDPYSNYEKPENTILTVAIFHNETGNANRKQKFSDQKHISGDSDDVFLGMASIDLTRLFTGKVSELDQWLPLTGTRTYNEDRRNSDYKSSMEGRRTASVRIVCEYELSDVPPNPGDICRFTRFCHPQDLYPLEPARQYKVEQVRDNGEVVHLMYQSKEGWVLSFQAHKNMLICEERHVSALDSAQTELQSLGERLSVSPLVKTVAEAVEKVADEGVVGLAQGIVKGSAFLFDRWFKGGVDTVIQDITDVTNLDGRHSADISQHLGLDSPNSFSDALDDEEEGDIGALMVEDSFPPEDAEALPNMPACPITGFPMVEPVVAADGFTYERSAMARWLKTSNKSPMTGNILIHKELVPNYGLLSSIRETSA